MSETHGSHTRGSALPYRMAFLTNFLPPYAVPVIEALASRVREVRAYVSTSMEANRQWNPDWGQLNVTVQRCLTIHRVWRHPSGFSEPLYLHIPYDTLWQLQQFSPHVVISEQLGLRSLQAALYRRLHPNSRLVVRVTVSERTEEGRGGLRLPVRRWILAQADAVGVNGRSGGRYVGRLGVPASRLIATPSVPRSLFELNALPLERRSGVARRLLFVGRIIELKGVLQFCAALNAWGRNHPDQPVEFWLAGDGPLTDSLDRAPLPPSVALRRLGHIAPADLPAIYGEAGILAFPTLADEWGLVVLEAMAAGLPVLGSLYSQAVEDLVEDGQNGWVFRTDHFDGMYTALDRALTVPSDVLLSMRSRARQRVVDLTPEYVADNLLRAAERSP